MNRDSRCSSKPCFVNLVGSPVGRGLHPKEGLSMRVKSIIYTVTEIHVTGSSGFVLLMTLESKFSSTWDMTDTAVSAFIRFSSRLVSGREVFSFVISSVGLGVLVDSGKGVLRLIPCEVIYSNLRT